MHGAMSHPYRFFETTPPARIANKIKELIITIPDLTKTAFDGVLCGFLTLVTATVAVGSVHVKFAIGLGLWMIIFVVGSITSLRRARDLGDKGLRLRSKIHAKIMEILENIKCVRFFNREEFEKKKLKWVLRQNLTIDREKEKCSVRTFAFQGFSFIVYQGICLFWLMNGFKNGQVTAGDFALILAINLSFVDRFRKISRDLMDFADLLGNLQQGLKSIIPTTLPEKKVVSPSKLPTQGEIVFKNVCFNYDGVVPLFCDKLVHIRANQKIAIVGHSGSGKSTFIHLILRLYEVISGEIMIDGKNINQLPLDSLYEMISVVPQTPSLFYGTIRDNIRYGRLHATDLEVIEAARKSDIHEFIESLPHGYDTFIDSSGLRLSAGQRQRIAIARAILKDAPIFILDEATAHLDMITESHIRESLLELMNKKTSIIITHRFSSLLLHMDQILVFDLGKIVESGKHDELFSKDGLYRSFWDHSKGATR